MSAGFCVEPESLSPDILEYRKGGVTVCFGEDGTVFWAFLPFLWARAFSLRPFFPRECLLETVERSMDMNIVVWKSPKALCGILKKLFKIPS